jgi:iron complex outermembrane receptor protein
MNVLKPSIPGPSLLLFLLVALVSAPSVGLAQRIPRDLAGLAIEDLMNIQITSASRKEQSAGDVAAAVFVITRDDVHQHRHEGGGRHPGWACPR